MEKRAKRISSFIYPLLPKYSQVLDFGCGDLLIAENIQKNRDCSILGIDVININLTKLHLEIYNGKKIPFKNKSFDATYAAFVFHHTTDVKNLLYECIRVTKRRLIILEDVYNNKLELFLLKIFDSLNKLFLSSEMNLPFNFRTESEWCSLFNELNLRITKVKNIGPNHIYPKRHRMFILDLD